MATPQYRKDLYKTRREIIRKHLNHGDIKRLAEKIVSRYPEVTQSNLSDYSNYLSQVFNPRSTRPFKDELARQIEAVWNGLDFGDLDGFNADDEYKSAMNNQFHEQAEIELIEQSNKLENDLSSGYKEDSVLPTIFLDALKWRMHQRYPNAEIRTNEILRLKSGDYIADLVVTNDIASPPILIIETSANTGTLNRLKKESYLGFLLSETGAAQGLIAMLDNGEITEYLLPDKKL